MKYVDEFRDPVRANQLIEAVRRRASRVWTIMEVCGGQTHSLVRYGIDEALRGTVELIHGPGCPVCVTRIELIDRAIELARLPGVTLTTFADMLRVPGSRTSLAGARGEGARVRAVYSPLDAVRLASQQPHQQIVFFAVGFETTVPATALAVQQASTLRLRNFSLLVAHVRVQPAMEQLMRDPDTHVQAFLAAGHVCTVLGYASYHEFCQRFRVPVVVTGFEPLDLLTGILTCVDQLETGRYAAENRYGRGVRPTGNLMARTFSDQVYEPCDQAWRGLGMIPLGGLRLRDTWRDFDAEFRFGSVTLQVLQSVDCRSGEVMAGKLKPTQCPEFGRRCTPESPLGAPMVSNEGACSAYFRYARHAEAVAASASPIMAPNP